MRLVVVLLVAVLLSAVAACDSNDVGSAAGTQSAFRNLGKRADSNLGGERGAPQR